MIFNEHSNLAGKHALLSPSGYHWLNYDEEKLISFFNNSLAKERGTVLHEFAAQCIRLNQKLPNTKKTLNMYVNDAIGFRMKPEQVLYFSDNCFGTADSISFKNDILRIHDYKSGETPAKFEQLFIYDALFCLEYKIDPNKIKIENRIYQFDECVIEKPSSEEINDIIKIIINADRIIEKERARGV